MSGENNLHFRDLFAALSPPWVVAGSHEQLGADTQVSRALKILYNFARETLMNSSHSLHTRTQINMVQKDE